MKTAEKKGAPSSSLLSSPPKGGRVPPLALSEVRRSSPNVLGKEYEGEEEGDFSRRGVTGRGKRRRRERNEGLSIFHNPPPLALRAPFSWRPNPTIVPPPHSAFAAPICLTWKPK